MRQRLVGIRKVDVGLKTLREELFHDESERMST